MSFKLFLMAAVLCVLLNQGFSKSLPDSAGRVPQPNGLSYGGIPYGSVSGQLSLYYGDHEPIVYSNRVTTSDIQLL